MIIQSSTSSSLASPAQTPFSAGVNLAKSSTGACACNGVQASQVQPEFAQGLNRILGPDAQGNIHEEELQHAVVVQLLERMSPDAAKAYSVAFDNVIGSGVQPVGVEDAVKLALKAIVEAGLVDNSSAEAINGVSFRVAQLDENLGALFDGKGSASDNTVAVMPIAAAIEKASQTLKAIEDGLLPAESRPLDTLSNRAPSGGPSRASSSHGGSAGFLWKPVSESDGKLVVLLPRPLTGRVQSAAIYSEVPASSETLLERGRFTGDSHNGGRAHFRFSRPGAGYPDGSYVVATLRDGQKVSFQIADSSRRNTG